MPITISDLRDIVENNPRTPVFTVSKFYWKEKKINNINKIITYILENNTEEKRKQGVGERMLA